MDKIHKSARSYKITIDNSDAVIYYFTLLNRQNKLVRQVTLTESPNKTFVELQDYFITHKDGVLGKDIIYKSDPESFGSIPNGREYFNFVLNEYDVRYDFNEMKLKEINDETVN